MARRKQAGEPCTANLQNVRMSAQELIDRIGASQEIPAPRQRMLERIHAAENTICKLNGGQCLTAEDLLNLKIGLIQATDAQDAADESLSLAEFRKETSIAVHKATSKGRLVVDLSRSTDLESDERLSVQADSDVAGRLAMMSERAIRLAAERHDKDADRLLEEVRRPIGGAWASLRAACELATPATRWSDYRSPKEWRARWAHKGDTFLPETTWKRWRDEMLHEQHPMWKRRIRFSIVDLQGSDLPS
jgi:hypothetical protein